MAEPLEVLVDMRDLLRELPEKIGMMVRPSVPERLPLGETVTAPIPVKVDAPREEGVRPEPPVSMPAALAPSLPALASVPREMPATPERVPTSLPGTGSMSAPSLPYSVPQALVPVQPALPYSVPQADGSALAVQPPRSSEVFPAAVTETLPSPVSQAPSPEERGTEELGGQMKELTDAIRALIAKLGSTDRSQGQATRSFHYVAPPRETKQGSPSRPHFGG